MEQEYTERVRGIGVVNEQAAKGPREVASLVRYRP
jgi:hypothetical protein